LSPSFGGVHSLISPLGVVEFDRGIMYSVVPGIVVVTRPQRLCKSSTQAQASQKFGSRTVPAHL
jgi:hypothetical protein